MSDLFESASRAKLRFPYKGPCTTEDLWDLSLTDLDGIYKNLNSQLKATQEESLLGPPTTINKELQLKVDVVRYVVTVKKAEADEKVNAKAKAQQRELLKGLIERKKLSDLESKSPAELQAMLDAL